VNKLSQLKIAALQWKIMRLRLFFALLAAASAFAQQAKYDPGVDEQKIELRLQPDATLDVVWAAWRARSGNSRRWNAPLRASLRRVISSDRVEDKPAVIGFLLDSLIQLKSQVPDKELLPLYPSYPDEVLALMANGNDHDVDTLLPLLIQAERENAPRWLLITSIWNRDDYTVIRAIPFGQLAL
jgi:hypothetical protein